MSALDSSRYLVDVVIPAFNAGRYINQTLESVALQGDTVQSVIIVNDGSTDNTAQVIAAFCQNHPHLTVHLIHQENQGLANARNAGIKAASAPFIALLDADDVWLAHKLSIQLALFNGTSDPKLGLVYCSYALIDENSKPILGDNIIIEPRLRGEVFSRLQTGNFISGSGSSVLIRSSAFQEIGYFDETLVASEDWDMWLRIAKKFTFDYVNQALVQIRVHPNNMQKDFLRMLTSDLSMLNKFSRHGQHNYFLLWKIRTILYKKKVSAKSIPGFDACEPWVRSQLSDTQNQIWGVFMAPLNSIWEPLKKVRNFLQGRT
jgi:glycosyltransferase involved in cell wall biosynthesis